VIFHTQVCQSVSVQSTYLSNHPQPTPGEEKRQASSVNHLDLFLVCAPTRQGRSETVRTRLIPSCVRTTVGGSSPTTGMNADRISIQMLTT
ncbi:hypothetical protein CH063_03937, partial [Colletotrichum higginsianum]